MGLDFPVEIRIRMNGLQDIKEILEQLEEVKKESTSIIKVTIEVENGN